MNTNSEREKYINSLLLQALPNIMYHGTSGIKYQKETVLDTIKIFNTVEEYNKYESINGTTIKKGIPIPRISCGRTNLDAAFHGFYLTADYDTAYEWAAKRRTDGQILKLMIDKEGMINDGCISLCFPNYEWLDFIIHNRNKQTTCNSYPATLSLIADGFMNELLSQIQVAKNQEDKIKLFNQIINKNIKEKYQFDDYSWNYDKIEEDICSYINYCQLCISSSNLLKYIKVIDILCIEKE